MSPKETRVDKQNKSILSKEFIEVYECAVLASLWKQNVITEEQYEWCVREIKQGRNKDNNRDNTRENTRDNNRVEDKDNEYSCSEVSENASGSIL